MIDETVMVGDVVSITIPKENREWGHNPCPDGTKATVIGFSETYYGRLGSFGLKPGVYVSRAAVKLLLEDGQELTESSYRLELTDKDEYERRQAEFRKYQQEDPNWYFNKKEFLRDLPETPFWEGDFVRVSARSRITTIHRGSSPDCDPDIFQIVGINYHMLAGKRSLPYTISIGFSAGWSTSARECDMTLVERGPVWKFYHSEPLTFGNVKEEAHFFLLIGQTEEIRNPINGLCKWTKDEVLDAIQRGLVHGFYMSSGLFGNPPSIVAVRFKDEDLGRRVAQETLAGFGFDERDSAGEEDKPASASSLAALAARFGNGNGQEKGEATLVKYGVCSECQRSGIELDENGCLAIHSCEGVHCYGSEQLPEATHA